MERVGIPVFESRVSPVLDSCNRLLVVDIDGGREVNRVEISLEKINISERIEIFTRWGIRKIICAGVSDIMCRYLAAKKIALISGIAGKLEEIINAYICDKLDDACFIMPGKGGQKDRSDKDDGKR
jgi:predicted Fe-Mo cluster-binding NifX family protein